MVEGLPKVDVGYDCWCTNRSCVGFDAEAKWEKDKVPVYTRGVGQARQVSGYVYPLSLRCNQCGTKWLAKVSFDLAHGDPPRHFHAVHD